MAIQFYIALYSTGNPHRYHWSLLPSASGLPSLRRRTKLYEISKERWPNSDRTHVSETWVCSAGERVLGASRRFLGILAFPPCPESATTLADVHALLDAAPAVPHGLSPDERDGWTCSKWVTAVLLESGPRCGLDFVRQLRTLDVLYSALFALSLRLEEGGYELASEDDATEPVRCVRFPEHYLARPPIAAK